MADYEAYRASWDEVHHVYDPEDTRSPINAGKNAGLIFGWSALCKIYGDEEHDVRLDGRSWD